MQRATIILLACALILAALTGGLLWRMADQTAQDDTVPTAAVGGPFALLDQDGHRKTDKDFRGHWVLLYFGYTNCPDVCPTTLALMASVLDRLGARAARVEPVFITVDPARDTPEVLKKYLAAFGPRFVGLTGTPGAIAETARAYRVYYAKRWLAGGSYSVDHSSVIYLLDPNGKFVKVYDGEAPPAAIADNLKTLL
jgi:cytochrome oxidase Cu insertion factor (SCO1/SenC/PrrC family)